VRPFPAGEHPHRLRPRGELIPGTYTYNPLMQLTADGTTTDGYDHAGDPTTLGSATQTFDAASELATSATSGTTATYGYNPRGDRTTATTGSSTTSYGYNQAGELTSYTPPAGTATSYTYNGDGLRATKTTGSTTATYAWDINASIPDMITDGSASYIYGPGGLPVEQISSAGTPAYLLQDQLGSTRLITSSTGTVTATYTYTYDAYGN
jgi:YD repeat-containing protein